MPPYDYDKTQLRAVVQGVYETLVRQRLGVPDRRSFGSGSKRLDIQALRSGQLTREDVSDLMGRAFAIAVAQGQKYGSIVPGTVKPTRQGVRRAYERLSRGWSDEDYERSLALARKPRVNPLPAAVGVGFQAAFWGASIGMLAWEGYQMFRKKNPRVKQIARAGEGSALAVRGRKPVDPQMLRGAFAIVPWQQDPQGFGYVLYTADRTFPREDRVLREAGLYLDRGLQKQFRKRGEGEVAAEAERAAEALAGADPVALARIVGPRSEAITRAAAQQDVLLGWLRSEDAFDFFRTYPLRLTDAGDLDLPEEYGEEIALAVERFAEERGVTSARVTEAAIYAALKRIFKVRRIGAYAVERTGIRAYRTAPNPSLSEAFGRVAKRLRAESGGADADVAERMYDLLARAARVGVVDSPYAQPSEQNPDVSVQTYEIQRAGSALAAAELAAAGDARGFRALGLKPSAGASRAQARARMVVVSIYERLTEGHQARAAREAWLLRQVQAEGQRFLALAQTPVRRNGAASLVGRAALHGARQLPRGARAARAWLRTPQGQRMLGQVMGVVSSLGLQVLVEEASKYLTPAQGAVLAQAITRETGVKVTADDVATALASG